MLKIENTDTFRKNIRNEIQKLTNLGTKNSTNLEKGLLNYSIKEASRRNIVKKWDNPFFVHIYTNRFRTIIYNIKNTKHLKKIIAEKSIKAHEIAFLTHQEMDPERWDEMLDKKRKRDKNKYESNESTTSQFTCFKCKSSNCTYYQLQTRSADEPMTTFVTCMDCANRWKF